MSEYHIAGVGNFKLHSDYWEGTPILLHGSIMSIESSVISIELQNRAQKICSQWETILEVCKAYIEASRSKYGLQAKAFNNPNVFINSEHEWAVYFDTEDEYDAVVGVEFINDSPFQLTIGD